MLLLVQKADAWGLNKICPVVLLISCLNKYNDIVIQILQTVVDDVPNLHNVR